MKISVIIPTLNRCHLLARAIQSVLQQTRPADEMIIIDDGSIDETAQFIKTQFPNVIYHFQPQQGVSSARNCGIRMATGNWLAFLDSDDEWHPQKLALQVQALATKPHYQLCHTNEIWIRHGKRVNPMHKHEKFGGWIFQHCLALCRISPSSVLLHRDVIDDVGCFDETLPACEDYDFWLRITANYPVLYLRKPLTIKYGGHGDQLSKQYWGMDRFRIQALDKLLSQGRLTSNDFKAAYLMLQEKIRIYLIGARKRNKFKEIRQYESILRKYTTICQD